MPVTTLDAVTALIVIDLQKGVVSFPTAHPAAEVIDRSAQLADAFRRHGLPVVLVTVAGSASGRTERSRGGAVERPADWVDLVPELNQQPDDHTVTKFTWGAFTNTGLDEHLKSLGVTQVVLTGIATSAGVESTARHAHENGYHVTLALDAMTDMSMEAHEYSTTHVFPKLGEAGTTAEILALLEAR
jgi:nicotinamidase-related amidase